jgi:hypothetical protein
LWCGMKEKALIAVPSPIRPNRKGCFSRTGADFTS